MSDTARDYQTFQPAATEGLEDLFEESVGLAQSIMHEAQDLAQGEDHQAQDLAQHQDQADYVPVAEAAQMLSVNRRYALRLLHKGKLCGRQDDKGQWFVNRASIMERLDQAQPKAQEAQGQAQVEVHVVQDQAQPKAQGAQDQAQSEAHDEVFEVYKEQIKELQHKLEAASYRIGYLEHERHTYQQQIKLLTDSQHKGSWWAGFRKWFFGQ